MLFNNLKKNNIIINAKSSNRWDLIDEMLDLAVKNNEIVSEDREFMKSALVEREKSMSTGIGNGVAIPHCTTSRIKEMVILMAINQDGIDFNAIDSSPVKIIILLLVPKDRLTQHIKTLANIARMMSDEKLRNKFLTLKTPDSIIKAIKNYNNVKK